jgi:PAS domain S-box-containing protein
MKAADIPADEQLRLAELASYGVLDTPSEPLFDMITRLAATICDTPVSLISLIDADRQWFKSAHGLPGVRETPRESAFCAHAILDDRLLEVPCSLDDARFRDNPLVSGPPYIRFYAGFPLVTPRGFRLGTLCVLDRITRFLPAPRQRLLESLSRMVVGMLELRRQVREHGSAGVAFTQALSTLWLFDPRDRVVLYRSGPGRAALEHTRLEDLFSGPAADCARMIDLLARHPGMTASCTPHSAQGAAPMMVEVTADPCPRSLAGAVQIQLDRWHAHREQRRLLRQMRLVRAVERASAGASTPAYADAICRLAVSVGRFMAAAVIRQGAQAPIIAAAGEHADRLRQIEPSLLAAVDGFVAAAGQGKPAATEEPEAAGGPPDPVLANVAGAESALYLPIHDQGAVTAVLALFSGEARYFSAPVASVLNEIPRHFETEIARAGAAEARARAERALAESEQRFRALTRLSVDWYWEQDEQLRFTLLGENRSSIGVLKQYLGRTRWELSSNMPLDGDWSAHIALLEARQPFQDFIMARRDTAGNAVGYISVSGEPVFDEGGRFRGYHGVGRDISAEFRAKQTLEVLFQLGQSLRATLDPALILRLLVEETVRLIPSEVALIAMQTPGGAVSAFTCGPDGHDCRPAEDDLWRGAGQLVLQRNAPLLVVEPADPRLPAGWAASAGVRGLLAVPMHGADGAVIGFVELRNRCGRAFSREDQAQIEAVRNVGELALQNALAFRDMAAARREVERDRARLAEAQQIAHVGSWELDLDSSALHWSDETYRIFGVAPVALAVDYRMFFGAVHPHDQARMQAAQDAVLAGGAPLDIEHRIVRLDGEVRHVHERGELLRGADGRPQRLAGTVQDVTERVGARAALEQAARRYRELFELNPSPTWVFRLSDLRFLMVNRAACVHFGYDEAELLAMTALQVRPEEERERVLRVIAEESQFNELSSGGVWRHLRKDGAERLVEGMRRPLVYDGEPCLIVIANDVTRREQVLGQLKRIGTALEEAFSEACIVDLRTLALSYLNAAARENLGCLPVETQTLGLADILNGGQAEVDVLLAPLRSGQQASLALETRFRRRDGSSYPVEMRLRVLGDGAECVMLANDISVRVEQRRALEEAGRRAQVLARRLLEIQEEQRRHIARELHDQVGQTLAATKIRLGAAHRAARGAGVRAELERCAEALDLTQAQLRALALDLRPPQLELLGLAAALRWQAEQTFGGCDIAVRCDCATGGERFDATIEAACFRVAQEAMNNARKHAGARNLGLELSADEALLRLDVADDGAGFDLAQAEHGVLEGRSLGLASMRERVSLLGGRFDIRSAPGEGTRIRAEFPLARGNPSSGADTQAP